MSGSDERLDPAAARVVAMAIEAAGEAGDDTEGWRARVSMLVPQIAAMLRPQSEQARLALAMMDAAMVQGTYNGYVYEPSSTRCKVELITEPSKWYPDGKEPFRTQRTDEPLGLAQRAWLDANFSVGDPVKAWKTNEKISSDGENVRILVHMEKVVATRNARAASPPQRSRGTGARRPTDEAPPPSVEAPAPNPNGPVAQVIRGLLLQLELKDRDARLALLKEQGWNTADDIPEEEKERAMYIVRFGRTDHF